MPTSTPNKFRRPAVCLLLALLAAGFAGCSSTRKKQAAVDEGYRLGQSDAVKRNYWQKVADDAAPGGKAGAQGRTVYYQVDQSGPDAAGRTRPADNKISVPIYEPAPVKP